MQIRVTIDVEDEYADPDHDTGLTQDGYQELADLAHTRIGSIDLDSIEVI